MLAAWIEPAGIHPRAHGRPPRRDAPCEHQKRGPPVASLFDKTPATLGA